MHEHLERSVCGQGVNNDVNGEDGYTEDVRRAREMPCGTGRETYTRPAHTK